MGGQRFEFLPLFVDRGPKRSAVGIKPVPRQFIVDVLQWVERKVLKIDGRLRESNSLWPWIR
jgi:hypothetical protein